jgi:cyclase
MTDPAADTPKLLTLGEGFCLRQAVDNIAWMDLGDCAVVVDALEQPGLEREVFAAIRSTLGDRPVRYVLNTHTHGDHTALNAAFRRRFGAEIVNQDVAPCPPEGRWFTGPRRRVLMLPMPGCHTEQDCVVRVEPDQALFVGDIFGWGVINLSIPLDDRSFRLLTDTYARLVAMAPQVVIPGHGPVCTSAELTRFIEYLRRMTRQVADAVAAGKSDRQILAETAPPEDMKTWWRFLQWKHQDSLTKTLRAVRTGHLRA